MNNHLLPSPYNSPQPLTWPERVARPLSTFLLGGPTRSAPQPPLTEPISLHDPGDGFPPIRIICISDTHNATHILPRGDILIHAGDLTAHGTFDEVQAQLRWLSCQPHTHKIVIAGNHDILLDEGCDGKFLTREGDSVTERKALDWGTILYLQDEAVTLDIPVLGLENPRLRRVKVYGSPLTPEFGRWAFQYPPIRDVWTGRIPDDTDILVVHGPPALYGDLDDAKGPNGRPKVHGDGYLLREIRRVKPKMVVCGHIHGAFGLAIIEHDGAQDTIDRVQMRWGGYGLSGILKQAIRGKTSTRGTEPPETIVVNAAVAPSELKREEKTAITIDYHGYN